MPLLRKGAGEGSMNEDSLRDQCDAVATHRDPHSPYYDGPFHEPDPDASSAWSEGDMVQLDRMATDLDLILADDERKRQAEERRTIRLLMMSPEAAMVMATYYDVLEGK